MEFPFTGKTARCGWGNGRIKCRYGGMAVRRFCLECRKRSGGRTDDGSLFESGCLTCISRPRRFGKSFAAKMLCAYYDKTCDSSQLFGDLSIACDAGYREHLNQHDVIYLDMTGIIGEAAAGDRVAYVKRTVVRELKEQYPQLEVLEGFVATLANAVEITGNKFIMIIAFPMRRFGWNSPRLSGR